MSCKRFRADAINEVINRETNLHFMNSYTRKIDLKMYLRHLNDKDEYANVELDDAQYFACSSDSDSPMYNSVLNNSSDSETINCWILPKK